ncbi:MAG: NAD-dependent epimerase/dehydratase family protein [Solirubrobacteraceae bacterium]
MRVAVTGAAGFVGGAVARALAERGHHVTAFTRREWDITKGPIDGRADAVVHSAALADDWAPLGAAMLANVIGTRNAVASFPGARIVHLSTSSVYDAFAANVNVREDAAPVERFLSTYSETKTLAEAELGHDAVVLRPHAVYGPGDRTLLPRILAGIRGRRLVLPSGAEVHHTLTHIDNLVDAVELSLTGPPGTYNVGDDTDVLLSAVLHEFLGRRGRRDVALTSIPYRAAFAAAAALETAARLSGRRPRLTRYAVSQLGLERTLDLTAAREHLGYRPRPTSLEGAERW